MPDPVPRGLQISFRATARTGEADWPTTASPAMTTPVRVRANPRRPGPCLTCRSSQGRADWVMGRTVGPPIFSEPEMYRIWNVVAPGASHEGRHHLGPAARNVSELPPHACVVQHRRPSRSCTAGRRKSHADRPRIVGPSMRNPQIARCRSSIARRSTSPHHARSSARHVQPRVLTHNHLTDMARRHGPRAPIHCLAHARDPSEGPDGAKVQSDVLGGVEGQTRAWPQLQEPIVRRVNLRGTPSIGGIRSERKRTSCETCIYGSCTASTRWRCYRVAREVAHRVQLVLGRQEPLTSACITAAIGQNRGRSI